MSDFCRRWRVDELGLFGSVLRSDFGQESDEDVSVRFNPNGRHTLIDMAPVQEKLRRIFSREVNEIIYGRKPSWNRRSLGMSRDAVYLVDILEAARGIESVPTNDAVSL